MKRTIPINDPGVEEAIRSWRTFCRLCQQSRDVRNPAERAAVRKIADASAKLRTALKSALSKHGRSLITRALLARRRTTFLYELLCALEGTIADIEAEIPAVLRTADGRPAPRNHRPIDVEGRWLIQGLAHVWMDRFGEWPRRRNDFDQFVIKVCESVGRQPFTAAKIRGALDELRPRGDKYAFPR